MTSQSCTSCQPCIPDLGLSLKNLNRFSKGLTSLVSKQASLFMDQALALAEETVLTSLPKLSGVCDFPMPEPCCPKVACTLIREVFQGERVVEPVLVHNRGDEAKEFLFETYPLKDSEMHVGDTPEISPNPVILKSGETATVTIAYSIEKCKAGHRYSADIKVNGYCEQTIRLITHVASRDTVRCTAAQKEDIKVCRHDWRDHFYCEPSAPRVRKDTSQAGKTK